MGRQEARRAAWPHVDLGDWVRGPGGRDAAETLERRSPSRRGSRFVGSSLGRSLETLPAEVLEQVLRFPVRHAPLLALLDRCEGARDLIDNNPALTVLITAHDRISRRSGGDFWAEADRLVRIPQREALAELGFPRYRRTIRILRKLDAECWTLPRLLRLREALADPDLSKTLAHARAVSVSALLVLTDPTTRPHVSVATVNDLAEHPALGSARFGRALKRALLSARQWGLSDRIGRPKGLRRLLRALLATGLFEHRDDGLCPDDQIGGHPLAGVPGFIEPITNAMEAARESAEQHNCALGQIVYFRHNRSHYYRVLWPERATLDLESNDRGAWRVAQLKAASNQDPHVDTTRRVWSWLLEGQLPISRELGRVAADASGPEIARACAKLATRALDSSQAGIRAIGIEAIVECRLLDAIEPSTWRRAAGDLESCVFEPAFQAITNLEGAIPPAFVNALHDFAKPHHRQSVRVLAVALLARLGSDRGALDELVHYATRDPATEVREAAVLALAELETPTPQVLAAWTEALSDQEERVRREANRVLSAHLDGEETRDDLPPPFRRVGHRLARRRRPGP